MTPTRHPQSDDRGFRLRNERGAALLIVLVMLLLLTILGVTLFTSSTTEIKVAGNYRNSLETFFTADAAIEFAKTDAVIYTTLIPDGPTTSWPPTQGPVPIPGTNNTATISVNLVSARNNPPPGYGYQEDAGVGTGAGPSFKANLFAISVEAQGPNDAKAEIEAGMARVVPH